MKNKVIIVALILLVLIGGISSYFLYSNSTGDGSASEKQDYSEIIKKINNSPIDTLMTDSNVFAEILQPEVFVDPPSVFSEYRNAIYNSLELHASSEADDTSVNIDISGYDDDEITKLAVADKGFNNDITNFVSMGISQQEIYAYVMKYVASAMKSNAVGLTKRTNTEKFTVSNGKMPSNAFIVDYCNKFDLDFLDGLIKLAQVNPASENNALNPSLFIRNCKIGEICLIYVHSDSESKYKCSIQVDKVYHGTDALEFLYSRSKINRTLRLESGADIFVVQYNVTNLDSDDFIIPNNFSYLDEQLCCYRNYGQNIVGISDSTTLQAGVTESLTAAIVVPEDAKSIYWRDKISNEIFKFDLNDYQFPAFASNAEDATDSNFQ